MSGQRDAAGGQDAPGGVRAPVARRVAVPGPPPSLGRTARLSLAACGPEAGSAVASYGDGRFVAASVMKVNILLALLLRAQGALEAPPRRLTERERSWAAEMITRSDNDAANALWDAAGGAAGLRAANRLLGAARTEPHPHGRWGLSVTTAADQLALLRALYGPEPGVLAPAARTWVRELMADVMPGQRWGVGAAADPGTPYELKNGWLPRTSSGLWVINSVGRVTAHGRPWLLAVLSDGHTSREEGVAAVEEAARAAVGALTGRPAAPAARRATGPAARVRPAADAAGQAPWAADAAPPERPAAMPPAAG